MGTFSRPHLPRTASGPRVRWMGRCGRTIGLGYQILAVLPFKGVKRGGHG